MTYDADARWWQNRANRYAEQVDNLQAEVAHQTAIVDRVRALAVAQLPHDNSTPFEGIAGEELLRAIDGEVPDGS